MFFLNMKAIIVKNLPKIWDKIKLVGAFPAQQEKFLFQNSELKRKNKSLKFS